MAAMATLGDGGDGDGDGLAIDGWRRRRRR
jgi:hypothetical protein